MSDTAVTTLVNGILQLAGMIVGAVMFWLKMTRTQEAIAANTKLTSEATDAATMAAYNAGEGVKVSEKNQLHIVHASSENSETLGRIEKQTNGMGDKLKAEIAGLKAEVAALKAITPIAPKEIP